ncbi:MAG TPA: FecR domain-containing protein [Candidatus Eremiobacteraceae bacterium]|nr:FecR domain-containing protein [Candidatus Eremiobacteraceae bacterium]
MECSEALDLLYESFDAQIGPAQQALLNGHRRTCFACAGTLAKAQRFQDLIRRVPQLTVPRGLETRILDHVFAQVGRSASHKQKVIRPMFSWRANWRPALATGGVLAAAVAVFFTVHGFLLERAMRPADQTITASVQGSLQAVAPDNRTREVAEAETPLSTGEVLRPTGAQGAVVAITSHLAVALGSGSEIQVSKLHLNVDTGAADAVYLKLRRGTIRVNEILHRDVSPIHVATNQASFVPTGTTFALSAHQDSTDLAVSQGSVQVLMPGRSFSVIAGHRAHITKTNVIRDVLLKPLSKLHLK